MACPVAKRSSVKCSNNKQHTHNSVTTDMSAAAGKRSGRNSRGSYGCLVLPAPLSICWPRPRPGLFLGQQHSCLFIFINSFSAAPNFSTASPSPLHPPPLCLCATLPGMSLCHLHDDNVFIILTQFQPWQSDCAGRQWLPER